MRTLARRLALPAAALTAALALTACQSEDTPNAAPKAPTAPTTSADRTSEATPTEATPTDTPTKGDTARPSTEPTARPSTRPAKPATEPGGGDATRVPCTAANTKVVASKVSRPVNHLVLTVTNVGSRPCDAPYAPLVGFDHSQAPIRIVEESKPQSVLGLAPGESAYASLILTGEPGPDTHGTTVRTIRVHLTPESSTTVAAPSGTYADDGAAVSYWQQTLEDALTY
ncbi:DUF4232 domain-containing protein [Streptomyces sp. NPDC012769]|uniref:DUF4232 domain-containing protein n=1 Tax=Streptomyces sp. NPDC012769 TaxID=3364848 RepID=UPI0036D05973